MMYYSSIKENEIMEFPGTCIEPECMIPREVTQTQRDKYYMFCLPPPSKYLDVSIYNLEWARKPGK